VRTGADPYTARLRALRLLDLTITRQSVVLALNHVFVLIAVLFVVALPLVLLLRATHHHTAEHEVLVE